jgi:CheY-like chemotaxis protein
VPRNAKLIILLVEDDPHFALLLQQAFRRVGVTLPVHTCTDGAEAMAYLKGERHYSDRTLFPFPRVLITDLEMPKCSGFQLLEWLYQHPECNLIPKIVLTGSTGENDVKRAYRLGANCFFAKPAALEELCQLVELVQRFWLAAVIPPLPKNC